MMHVKMDRTGRPRAGVEVARRGAYRSLTDAPGSIVRRPARFCSPDRAGAVALWTTNRRTAMAATSPMPFI